MKLTNQWNQFVYRLWAPIYDSTVNQFFTPGRQRALELLGLRPGERVLIMGVGTGADLSRLPAGVQAIGIDLSAEMLAKARGKLSATRAAVGLVRGDAQTMFVAEDYFDAAILNLILSVVPDGRACLAATLRALKPGGRAVVFDKFLPEQAALSAGRRFINLFSTLLGTDITRRFGMLSGALPCAVILDEASLLGGMYRVILLKKTPRE